MSPVLLQQDFKQPLLPLVQRIILYLPGVQDKFSQEIIKLQKPTAVVLINGGVVAIEWLYDNAPAIIEAWYPGFQGGNAIADVLFGDYNPGGKLPVTFYKADYINQVDFTSMDMTKAPGRSYKYYTGTPLWPFGYGLSYTRFKLEWHNSTKPLYITSNLNEASVSYDVNITNIGDVAGDEVVQAYFKPDQDPVIIKQLFGFQRVHLHPMESVLVHFSINYQTLRLGDQYGNMISLPGYYGIEITNGASESLKTVLLVKGEKRILESYHFT